MAISLFGKRVVIIEDGDNGSEPIYCEKCCFQNDFCNTMYGASSDILMCEDEYGEYHRHFQEVGTDIKS